jgi:hypothetical protein
MKKLLVMALVLVASNALAQNGLGIFFDTAGIDRTNLNPTAGTFINMYLVAKDISRTDGISAWECEIVSSGLESPEDMIYSFSNPTDAVNVLVPPRFAVGMAPILPTAPSIYLMKIRLFYTGGIVKLGVGPATPSSFGGLAPGYANGPRTILTPFTPVSNLDPVPDRPNYYYVLTLGAPSPPLRMSSAMVRPLFRAK